MMQGVDIHDIGRLPVIVGSGIAGLMTALHLAPEPVVLLSRAPLGFGGSSALAQGGIAASVGPDDHPSLHAMIRSQPATGSVMAMSPTSSPRVRGTPLQL